MSRIGTSTQGNGWASRRLKCKRKLEMINARTHRGKPIHLHQWGVPPVYPLERLPRHQQSPKSLRYHQQPLRSKPVSLDLSPFLTFATIPLGAASNLSFPTSPLLLRNPL